MIATNNGSYPGADPEGPGPADEAALDRRTRQAIDAQVRAGLDLVTDGLVRRQDPAAHVAGRLAGVTLGGERRGFPGSGVSYRVPIVQGEIAWSRPILTEDFLFAKGGSARPVKPVLPGPYTLSRLAEDRAYNDPMAMAMGFAIALNVEIKALQAAGATWVQIDEPALLEAREDFPLFTRIWEVLGRGIGLTLCLHLEGSGAGELYPGLARLKRLGCLSLDGVRDAAGLERLAAAPFPEALMLGLGLVDGRSERVEDPEEMAARIRGIRGLPPLDRVVLGTASDLGTLGPGVAFSKLQALARARDLLDRPRGER